LAYPGTVQFFWVPPIISGSGKATDFCTHIHRVNQNRSLWKFGKSSRGHSQGVPKIFRAPIYGEHCAVIFATAQLSCHCRPTDRSVELFQYRRDSGLISKSNRCAVRVLLDTRHGNNCLSSCTVSRPIANVVVAVALMNEDILFLTANMLFTDMLARSCKPNNYLESSI